MPLPSPGAALDIRRVATLDEYGECVAIQRETWGADFAEVVPPAIMMVSQKIGGVTAAAFAPDGRMLGFVFGLAGVRDGRVVHWSDLLAVRPEAQGLGIGARLKRHQRELARAAGAERMYWTYDPLVARNAHLNLVRLGARVVEYVPDMYGSSTGSVLHEGIGTDRFVVEWELSPTADFGLPASNPHAPVVNPPDPSGVPRIRELADEDEVHVAIPEDLASVLASDPARARAWRETTREVFGHYLRNGYSVAGLAEDGGHARYVLTRRTRPQSEVRRPESR